MKSVSQGSTGYFDWASNAVNNRDVYYRYGKFLRVEKPVVDVAMFYPAEAQRLRVTQPTAQTFTRACAYLRDVGNFDIVDDRMVRDGCLSGYRVLVLWEGLLAEPETLAKIKAWVEEGGVLLAYDFGKVRTFAGDDSWFQDLFGYYKELAPARVTERYAGNMPPQYRISVGKPEQADYLGDTWQDAEKDEDGNTFRWTGDKATVRLPVLPDKRYTLIVRATLPPEAEGLKHQVFLSARRDNIKLGDMSSTGDVTYRFPIPEGVLTGRSLATLTIQSDTLPQQQNRAGQRRHQTAWHPGAVRSTCGAGNSGRPCRPPSPRTPCPRTGFALPEPEVRKAGTILGAIVRQRADHLLPRQ